MREKKIKFPFLSFSSLGDFYTGRYGTREKLESPETDQPAHNTLTLQVLKRKTDRMKDEPR